MAEGGRRRPRKFNLAFIGKAKSGKSFLIKALLQAQFQLESEACLPATDALECTQECSKYDHPESPVTLWDVPGYGTQNEPLNGYVERIEMSKYDGFIVCCGGPVTEDEIFLNNAIAKMGRRYIFVRTKIDIALENDKKAKPLTFDMADCLKRIRANIDEKLAESGVSCFLVSSHLDYTGYTENFFTLQLLVFDKGALSDFMRHSNRMVSRGDKYGQADWKRF